MACPVCVIYRSASDTSEGVGGRNDMVLERAIEEGTSNCTVVMVTVICAC